MTKLNFYHTLYVFLDSFEWSKKDKGNLIEIESPTRLRYPDINFSSQILNNIRTTKPIFQTSAAFYFEAKIVSCGPGSCIIAIGLTQANPHTRSKCFPGEKKNFSRSTLGIGYHGYDGGIYHESFRAIEGTDYYKRDDVVGCYACRAQLNGNDIILVQFTKNGKKIFGPRILKNFEWYPTIGFGEPGVIVDTNFGSNQFTFNVEGMCYISPNLIDAKILVNEIAIHNSFLVNS